MGDGYEVGDAYKKTEHSEWETTRERDTGWETVDWDWEPEDGSGDGTATFSDSWTL